MWRLWRRVFPQGSGTGGTAVAAAALEVDEPVVYELSAEEIRVPYVQIIEPAAGNCLITVIEVLSPDNKLPGPGRKKYLKKRRELRASRAHLVEIDLLRDGKSMFGLPQVQLDRLQPWRYMAGVTRWPNRQEVYPIALEKPLPRVRIPLGAGDADVRLDLQAVFTRCWQEGPYPELLAYDGPPPGELTAEELAWCQERLAQAGLRPSDGSRAPG
jgi:hypothetical protein